jgi:aspartyl-tRNA(Asn)/glutamyl-tRNA(Gln) amidotransferase subunit A
MAAVPDDVFFNSVTEINRRLKSREFKALDLVRAFVQRLEHLGPRYNALALLLPQQALHEAKNVDADIKLERYRGVLQGVPFGAKDLLAYKGQPTTWGARPYASQVFDYTANIIQKLSKTGSVLIGKLAMIELAGGGGYRSAAASMTGPGLNPWDRTRWSGGSSSGSGIAVAAGLVPFALGSETNGSILNPSAFCGVTGLRPTYGLVSRHGAMPLSCSMDKIGPMCRSADDCGHVLHAIAGGDHDDPASAGKSFYYTPEYSRKMTDLKVGFAAVDFEQWAEPDARPAFAKALDAFRSMGIHMTAAKLPDLPYDEIAETVITADAASVFEPLIQSGEVNLLADAKQIAGLKAGLEIPARDYLRAMRIRSIIQQSFHEVFADVDLLLTPTWPGPAPKLSQPLDQPMSDSPLQTARGLTDLISAGNLAGLPALSLPCGFARNLPVAISVVGPAFSENTLIAVGREFQKITAWHRRHPPV